MQNPSKLFIFGCVLRPEAVEVVSKQLTGLFFILVDECNLDTKVFMIIEKLSTKSWKQKLGQSIGLVKINARLTQLLNSEQYPKFMLFVLASYSNTI